MEEFQGRAVLWVLQLCACAWCEWFVTACCCVVGVPSAAACCCQNGKISSSSIRCLLLCAGAVDPIIFYCQPPTPIVRWGSGTVAILHCGNEPVCDM